MGLTDSLPSITPFNVGASLLCIGGLTIFPTLLGRALRNYVLVPKLTFLGDLPRLGRAREGGKLPGSAVVCGGSIAGLLAATVCADHFESVLVVEPDSWALQQAVAPAAQPELRPSPQGYDVPINKHPRLPQFFSLHAFLPPVYLVLNQLFSNLQDTVNSMGIPMQPMKINFRYGGKYIGDPSIKGGAPFTFPTSRQAFEGLLRKLVASSRNNITFQAGAITGLIRCKDEPDRISGVTFRGPDGTEEPIECAMVVDATGSSQMGAKWLPSAGFPLSPKVKDEYNPGIRYMTGWRNIPSHILAKIPILSDGKIGNMLAATPDASTGERRVLYIGMAENQQLQTFTGGWGNSPVVTSIADYRTYARSLNGSEHIEPWFWELVDALEKYEDECTAYHSEVIIGPLKWVRYDNETSLPANFVAVGDAFMKLNPIFGQGVAKSAIDAATLDGALRSISRPPGSGSVNIGKAFYKRLTPRVASLWEGAKAMDYGYDTTTPAEGETLDKGAFMRKVARQSILLARQDPDAFHDWYLVNMMLAPPTDLLAPWFIYRMARSWILG